MGDITCERLKELVAYDPYTGVFTWAKTRRRCRLGDRAGCNRRDGYLIIRLDDTLYLGHRLAWLYMTGVWPSKLLDHIDQDKTNCRWANLREANASQNGQNKKAAPNKTGFSGVYASAGRYKAQLKKNRKVVWCGSFDTAEAAHKAYLDAKRQHHSHYVEPVKIEN